MTQCTSKLDSNHHIFALRSQWRCQMICPLSKKKHQHRWGEISRFLFIRGITCVCVYIYIYNYIYTYIYLLRGAKRFHKGVCLNVKYPIPCIGQSYCSQIIRSPCEQNGEFPANCFTICRWYVSNTWWLNPTFWWSKNNNSEDSIPYFDGWTPVKIPHVHDKIPDFGKNMLNIC